MIGKRILMAAGAIGVLATSAAYALPTHAFEIFYYETPAMLVPVGSMTYMCHEQGYLTWGVTSPYYVTEVGEMCNHEGPPGPDD